MVVPGGQVDQVGGGPINAAAGVHVSDNMSTQEVHDANVASIGSSRVLVRELALEPAVAADHLLQQQQSQQDCYKPDTKQVVKQADVDEPLQSQRQHSQSEQSSRLAQNMGNTLYKKWLGGRHEPYTLLHLPADVLELIIKEVTHTNDLCALSLTCSALHAFAIPHIYSRFDIVWPDSAAHVDPKSGVDALTYGLSTLVMAEELFGEAPLQQQQPMRCEHCGHVNLPRPQILNQQPRPDSTQSLGASIRRRRRYGNHYAQYCRKFSLGNGPKEWVQDYMVSKEAGKLLGTQVALAVARMRNLESFVWDMPTGIVQEVWMALASLNDRLDDKSCRLERVWIRWHNNAQLLSEAEDVDDTESPLSFPWTSSHSSRCESPTFSILPPLKSLSVVDIDEIEYLDEMAVLIARSRHCLRELRVGIAAYTDSMAWQSSTLADPLLIAQLQGESRPARMGGVLGTLFARIFSVTSAGIARDSALQQAGLDDERGPTKGTHALASSSPPKTASVSVDEQTTSSIFTVPTAPTHADADEGRGVGTATTTPSKSQTLPMRIKAVEEPASSLRDGRLPLEILELERVPLSVFTMREAIDWSKLTEITLLDCAKHERFWRALRRQFSRSSSPNGTWQSAPSSEALQSQRSSDPSAAPDGTIHCQLRLRKIHVNSVSPALLCFIRDTLAPNTLQTLFLHACCGTEAIYNVGGARHVALDAIYKSAVRRHARSLVKLSIDSGMRAPEPRTATWLAVSRRAWTLNREVLAFITSGRMGALRELSVCLDHRDWHFFLQRLPCLHHIRSLYIPQILDRSTGRPIASPLGSNGGLGGAREFAQQVLDIIVLRPEVQLCYLGMFDKCFEILEGRTRSPGTGSNARHGSGGAAGDYDDHDSYEHDDDDDHDEYDDEHDEHEEEEHEHDDNDGALAQPLEAEAEAEEEEDEADEDADEDHDEEHDDPLTDDDSNGIAADELAANGDDDGDDDDNGEEDHARLGQTRCGSRDPHHHHGAAVRLREILFYDDKVSIFRARLGRL